jgi:hypothetical protein
MKTRLSLGAAAFLCATALACAKANASPVVIDFESLLDGTMVTTIADVSFSNAVAYQAGLSLNDGEFPPHSGSVVVSDEGGPISLLFSTPVTQVGAFFTYVMPVTLSAWNALDVFLGSTQASFSINTVSAGDPGSSPNEFLQLAFAEGIAKLTVSGDAGGGSFVLDDLTFATPRAVPEPGAVALVAIGLAGLLTRRRFPGVTVA